MSDPVEITITAKDAHGNHHQIDFEYRPKAADATPKEATGEIYRGLSADVQGRISPVNQDG